MMDRESPVTEEELHAYIDGKLPADRQAAVEAWLAAHPEHAALVNAWRAQAELIKARYGGIALEPVPARLDLARLRRLERRWTRSAVAAAIAAFLIGGLLGWFGHDAVEGGAVLGKTLTTDAIDAHKLYVVEVRHPVEVPGAESAHLVQWLSKRLGYDLRAPDLGAIGLKLVGGRLLPGPSGAAGFLMYEGSSGERFTLYCARWDAPETALRYRDAGQIAAFYWVDDNKAYVMSGPADRDRLRKIAQLAYDQLENRGTGKGRS
ncbi:MAG TPA: anti-sigma factor [Xanthobacteraceae bacterium]